MARGRKKKEADEEEPEYFSVKCGLGSIILPPYRQALITIIGQLSINATYIAYIASLLFLFKVIISYFVCSIKCIVHTQTHAFLVVVFS